MNSHLKQKNSENYHHACLELVDVILEKRNQLNMIGATTVDQKQIDSQLKRHLQLTEMCHKAEALLDAIDLAVRHDKQAELPYYTHVIKTTTQLLNRPTDPMLRTFFKGLVTSNKDGQSSPKTKLAGVAIGFLGATVAAGSFLLKAPTGLGTSMMYTGYNMFQSSQSKGSTKAMIDLSEVVKRIEL